jgi:hypothetical protein
VGAAGICNALALLQLGRPAEARPVLDAMAALGPIPPALAPLWYWRQVLLALAERNLAAAGREAGHMAAALAAMGPGVVPEHQNARFETLAAKTCRGPAYRQASNAIFLLTPSSCGGE